MSQRSRQRSLMSWVAACALTATATPTLAEQAVGFSSLAPGGAIGSFAGGFSFPTTTIGDARHALLGPNLMLPPVPEPAQLGLLLAGLGLVVLRKRRTAP